MQQSASLSEIFRPGVQSIKRNWPPIVLIQVAAIFLLWAFYSLPSVASVLESIGSYKLAWGLTGTIVTGAFSGGIMPEFAKAFTRNLPPLNVDWLKKMLYTAFVYAVIGFLVDRQYFYLSLFVGTGHDLATLVKKICFDMLIFSPFLSMPVACGLFAIWDANFKWSASVQALTKGFYRDRILPSLVMCWAFWLPVVTCVYSFPFALQFPIAMLAQAAWSVLFVFMNTASSEMPEASGQ